MVKLYTNHENLDIDWKKLIVGNIYIFFFVASNIFLIFVILFYNICSIEM